MRIQILNKPISFILFLVLLLSVLPTKAQKAASDYIQKHKDKALLLKQESGIPACIILGVSFVESAMGKSRNCKLLNNYFGIKGKNSLAKVKGGPRSAYKQYPNALSSFKDFVRIVKTKKYYPNLKGNKDYKLWLKKMNQHGYAEAKSRWIEDVTSVIEKYNLAEIDNEILIFDDDSFSIWGTDTTMMLDFGE